MLISRACGLAAISMMLLCPELAPETMAQAVPVGANEVIPFTVTARGAWSPTVSYVLDDLVTSRGSSWRARRASLNKVPGQTSPSTALDWEAFAVGFNPRGAWTSSVTYQPNDVVLYLSSTWRSKLTGLNKVPGVATSHWEQLAAKGATGATGAKGATGATGAKGATGATGAKGATGATGATGPQGPAGPNSVADGTASAPSIHFTSSTGTGIFSPSTGKIALVEGGNLFLHNIGNFNTALGFDALDFNTTGFKNIALGDAALFSNTIGNNNLALGPSALFSNTTGSSNAAVGLNALFSNTTGILNTAVGISGLGLNTSGGNNTAVGYSALFSNTTGGSNLAVGYAALLNNTTGNSNIAVGYNAGFNPTAPSSSIFIGNNGAAADTNVIKIGTQGTQTKAFIAGIRGVTTGSNNGVAVLVDSNGQLGTVSSSRRYKDDIQPMGDVSAALNKLRPVTFRYKKLYDDGSKPIQYGLIAEEVAEVLPDLTVFNADGQPETVKYHLLPALLLNEYQRQQKIIALQAEQAQQQRKTIQSQAEQMAALERRFSALEARLAATLQTAAQPDILRVGAAPQRR